MKEDLDTAAVLARHAAARGGHERWQELKTLKITAEINMNGRVHQCTLLRRLPDQDGEPFVQPGVVSWAAPCHDPVSGEAGLPAED